jgi:lipopolysaccharide transport system ATP-binding protein
MSGESIIELKNVGVRYRRKAGFMRTSAFWALHDVSFDLKHGETLGVIGRNGAGKSTLLRLLAGILAPDTGSILRRTERVSLLALQAGFIPSLTGRQNAVLSGLLLGLTRRQVEERMDEMVRFAELEQFIDEPVRTYSSGMRVRLGFTVAFQADPDVLLIDEVLGVGDAGFKARSSAAMRRKIASDKTVVIVTHQADTVLELCDRVVWVEKGVTVEMGEPATVVEHYQKSLQPAGRRA